MMSEVPLEGVTPELGYREAAIDVPVLVDQVTREAPCNIQSPSHGPSWRKRFSSSLCCRCACNQSDTSTPIHQIQPVILKPTNDIYLELKPHRRLRVIHIPPGGTNSSKRGQTSSRNGSQAEDNNSDTDSEEYWFDNADPKRPQIEAQSTANVQQRRIFHKLAPQERPTLHDLTTKHDKNFISPGRLPRKKFAATMDEIDSKKQDSKSPSRSESPPKRNGMVTPTLEEDPVVDPLVKIDEGLKMSDPLSIDVPDLISNLNEIQIKYLDDRCESPTDSGKRSPKNFDVESPESTLRRVITLPNPGESSTDDAKTSIPTSVVVSGSFLGGVANIGFEADEELSSSRSSLVDSLDAGYKRNRAISELTEKIEEIIDTIKHPLENCQRPLIVEANNTDKDQEPKRSERGDAPDEKRPILFFIHGVGGSADSWQNQLSHFSSLGYEVIAPDLLGHGFSSTPNKPKAYVFTKLFRDVLTVFDHFCVGMGRQNPVVLIGHSYGSSISTAIARSRPDHVKVLVLIASGGPTALAPPQMLGLKTPKFMKCLAPLLKCGFMQRKRVKSKGKFTGVSHLYDVPEYVIRHTISGQVWPEGDVAFHRRITIPTLLVYGLKDGFVSLVEMCEMERTLPKAYLELIPMAGHHVMQDSPKELNAMMKKFVEKYNN